ncbi:MAG: hypothetical protein ACJAZM_001270, partial [Cyclobacteriaceae bacterium]
MAKKRSWKFWTSRTLLTLLLVGTFWVVNLIWFRPFNISHFYDKVFIEFALSDPELVTQLGIPVLYDIYKDDLSDASDQKNQEEMARVRSNYETLLSYDFESQSEANKLNTQILGWYLAKEIEGEQFFYHGYPVNQMFGVQSNLPSMMESSHKLRDKSDVEAYITRLSKFDTKFNQIVEGLK